LSKVCNWNHYKPEILRFIYKLCQNVNETQPWTPNCQQRLKLKKNNEKIWLLNLNPKIMYDCHTDRKIPNFFSIRYSMTQKLFIFDPYFGPPFWTLSLPSNLASKSHTNIFLWWPKSIYFCNSSLFLSLNQKKSWKNPPKKKNLKKKLR